MSARNGSGQPTGQSIATGWKHGGSPEIEPIVGSGAVPVTAQDAGLPLHRPFKNGGASAIDVWEIEWSRRKLRFLALMVIACAAAGVPFLTSADKGLRIVGLLWTGAFASCLIDLYRRGRELAPVLTIDRTGILDRRMLARPIGWWEIAHVFPPGSDSSRVVELQLRHAEATFATRGGLYRWLWLPIDRRLRRLHLPDVCISLVLLDASPTQVMTAIARHRPDLVPHGLRPHRYEPSRHTARPAAARGHLTG